jgi:DNA-binding beta-propeller fold protein YncE
VVNTGDDTISVINGAACNATVTSDCRQTPAHVTVGRQNFGFAAADPATNLVYVTNYLEYTVSVINCATCNGTNTSGCGRTPPTIPAGANPSGLTASLPNHTISAADNATGTGPTSAPPTPSGPKQRRRGRARGPRHRAAGTDAQIRAYLRALQRQPPITRNRS